MRKLISLAMGVALAATVFAAVPASAEPAMVIHDQGQGGLCGLPGADVDSKLMFGGLGVITHVVQNKHHAVWTCKGSGVDNDSGSAQQFSGFYCAFDGPDGAENVTYDTRATVSKSGKAMMKCRVNLR